MKRNGHFFLLNALFCALSFFAVPAHAVNIGDNFRISDMGPNGNGSYVASAAQIAYNSTDNQYLVVWSADDNTAPLVDNELEIFGQLLDADGTAVGSNFRISDMGPDGNTSYGAFNPAVTYNSETNQYYVVWFGDDNTAPLVDEEYEVFGQLIDADGTEAGVDTRLSDMGANGNTSYDAVYPSVAYNSTGNQYLVVWQGDDNTGDLVDNEYEAWGQLVNASGVEVGSDFRISDMGPDGSNLYNVDYPKVAYNETDNQYMVVWSGDDDTAPLVNNELEIFAQLLNANGSEDGGDFRISDMGPNGNTSYGAFAPQIAYNSAGNQYFVVWYGDDNTAPLVDDEYEIFGQLIDADGTENGTDFRVSSMGPDGNTSYNVGNMGVSYSSGANLYFVVWQGDSNAGSLIDNELEIWGQLINADGSEEGTDERISDMGPDGNTAYIAASPAVSFNSTDNGFLVVWHGDDNTDPLVDNEYEIFGQFFNNPIDCSLGYYSETGNDGGDREAGCTICPVGQYQNFTGQTECNPCPAGYFQSAEGSMFCFECAPGTVQPDTGQAGCNDCPAGQYQDEAAQLTCDLCAAGTFQADVRSITCNLCNYGTVQPDTGQASCDNCPAGYHQDELGQTECKACAAGQFNASEGEAFCDNCLAGTYSDAPAQTECLLCPTGTYQGDVGQIVCSFCAVDTFAAEAGSASCEACAEGFTSDEGAVECSEVVDNSGDDDTTDETPAASSGCQLVLPKM